MEQNNYNLIMMIIFIMMLGGCIIILYPFTMVNSTSNNRITFIDKERCIVNSINNYYITITVFRTPLRKSFNYTVIGELNDYSGPFFRETYIYTCFLYYIHDESKEMRVYKGTSTTYIPNRISLGNNQVYIVGESI